MGDRRPEKAHRRSSHLLSSIFDLLSPIFQLAYLPSSIFHLSSYAQSGMNRVRILPEHVANQIAAGEVVERPASVVKELVENALDAGARRISVTIERGGKELVRVEDDGTGLHAEDVRTAFERHATSKLETSDDLRRI